MNCATSNFSHSALDYFDGKFVNYIDHLLLITCPNYVLKCDKENGKFTKILLSRMLPSYIKSFQSVQVYTNDWIKSHSQYLVTPLHLIATAVTSLDSDSKAAVQMIAVKILEHGLNINNPDLNETHTYWTPIIYSALQILLKIARLEPQLINSIRESKDSFEKITTSLRQLINDQEQETIQLEAFELLVLTVPEENIGESGDETVAQSFVPAYQLTKLVDTERVCFLFAVLQDMNVSLPLYPGRSSKC